MWGSLGFLIRGLICIDGRDLVQVLLNLWTISLLLPLCARTGNEFAWSIPQLPRPLRNKYASAVYQKSPGRPFPS